MTMLQTLLKCAKKVLILLIMSAMFLQTVQAETYDRTVYNTEDKVIALDAGQYIDQPGKRSPDGYQEVKYTMDMVNLVEQKIKAKRPDIRIILTNPDGRNTGLSKRAKEAKLRGADFLISFHMDAIGSGWQTKVSGTHIITDKNANYETKEMAAQIVDQYSKVIGVKRTHNNGTSFDRSDVSILKQSTTDNIPSMLLEMGFMDNYEQAMKFRDKDYLETVAEVLADAIVKTAGSYLDKTHNKVYETEIVGRDNAILSNTKEVELKTIEESIPVTNEEVKSAEQPKQEKSNVINLKFGDIEEEEDDIVRIKFTDNEVAYNN